MQRREFLSCSGNLLLTLPLLPTGNHSKALVQKNRDYQVHKLTIGQFGVSVFKDLVFKYQGKDYFTNAPTDQVAAELSRYEQKIDHIPSPFVALLIEQGSEKILVDTGIGFFKEPVQFRGQSYHFRGQLLDILQQEGVSKQSITQVILTHFHPDHIGGLFDESGQPNFPNAKVSVHEAEWAYWHSAQSANQPPLFHYFIKNNITPFQQADLTLLKGKEAAVLPGITAIQIPGHTPGQIALRIASQSDKLLYISDAFLHPLHIKHLDWQTNYDLDHELARKSRVQLLELAHQEKMLIQAFHFQFPGLGNVDKTGNNWQWVDQQR
jgi:glyoxylase-like metal-dependent hydrolase (beta-lactamase superfamily II)